MICCFVCAASTKLQAWCLFSCVITLYSNCLQIHRVCRVSQSLSSRAKDFAAVLCTRILCPPVWPVSLSFPLPFFFHLPSTSVYNLTAWWIIYCGLLEIMCLVTVISYLKTLCRIWPLRFWGKVAPFPFPSPIFNLLYCSVISTEFWEQDCVMGVIGSKALITYPGVTKSNPVFHTITKLLKTQICIIIEIIYHAYILPATVLFLENLCK